MEWIPINCTVPAVAPQRAHEITAQSGCGTAKVKVADHPESLAEDVARVEAVRDALGPDGAIRVDANGVWNVDTAVKHIGELDRAAAGLEYVEQPCRSIEELAAVRRSLQVAEAAGLPCVVSSALETSVGLGAQLALAGARPGWTSPAASARCRC